MAVNPYEPDHAFFTLDAKGLVTSWNAGAERVTGYRSAEIVGRHLSRFYRVEDVSAGKCELDLEAATREGRVEEEAWRVRKDGSLFWAHVVILGLHVPDAHLVGFATLTRDLTESRKVWEDRERLAELRETSRLQDELFAALSQELRAPMNVILGWSTLLQESRDLEFLHKGLVTIRRNANAQLALLDEIVDMARVVCGTLRTDPVAMDFSAVVREALDAAGTLAGAKGVVIALNRFDDPIVLVGDPNRLGQVAWNVLSNAVKFSDAGGRVVVSLMQEGATVQLRVEDEGLGIDPNLLPHVFEPFRRTGAPATRDAGLGLGLAIARNIVEQHGGRISAASDGARRGAVFSVALPIRAFVPARAADEAGGPGDRPPAPPQARLDGVRILVVEDEADARELLELLLRERGAIVQSAARAEDARRSLASSRPDVIISDIGMPDEDGYAFLRAVRSLPEDAGGATPAIALTAYSRAEDRLRALAAGYSRHLAKPIERTKLLEEVYTLLEVGKRRPRAPRDPSAPPSSGSN